VVEGHKIPRIDLRCSPYCSLYTTVSCDVVYMHMCASWLDYYNARKRPISEYCVLVQDTAKMTRWSHARSTTEQKVVMSTSQTGVYVLIAEPFANGGAGRAAEFATREN